MNWLEKPYYTPSPDLRQDIQATSVNGWSVKSTALGIEGYLQSLITSSLSSVDSWLNPSYYNPRARDKSLDGFVVDFIWDVMNRIRWYPTLGANIDPVSLGTKYAQIFVATLKQINSGGMTGGTEGVSLWDAWVSMK